MLFAAISVLFLSCRSNLDNNPNEDFYTGIFSGDSDPKKVNDRSVERLKENIYMLNDTLCMGIPYYEKTYDKKKQAAIPRLKGTYLLKIEESETKDINLDNYRFLLKDLLATDDEGIYYFPPNYEVPSVIKLDLDPDTFQFLDDEHTFVKDDKRVFCLPANSYLLTTSEDFLTFKIKGVVFGTDGKYLYEYDERISPEIFRMNYNFISLTEKDSIIKRFLKN